MFVSHSEQDTRRIGHALGKIILPGITALLYGELGTGKTVFVRGVGDAFNISCVRSPSFTLINEYKLGGEKFLVHADLYRLDENSSGDIGLEEYADSDDVMLFVEWPERLESIPGENIIRAKFTAINETKREIKFSGVGAKALRVLEKL